MLEFYSCGELAVVQEWRLNFFFWLHDVSRAFEKCSFCLAVNCSPYPELSWILRRKIKEE